MDDHVRERSSCFVPSRVKRQTAALLLLLECSPTTVAYELRQLYGLSGAEANAIVRAVRRDRAPGPSRSRR